MTTISSNAQVESVIKPGLLRTQLTISPSYMLSARQTNIYLHGNIEGYLTSRLSLSGEGYYYLGSYVEESLFDYHHTTFFGASWHFTKDNHDLYIGLQPGLSLTQLNRKQESTRHSVNPLFSTIVGYNFYLNKIFHFFIQGRLILGQHQVDAVEDLSELRFSGGLGFNLNTN